jgi:hypothetical protein
MCRTKGAGPITPLEAQAALRLRHEDKLSWTKISEVLRRDRTAIRRAYDDYISPPKTGRPVTRRGKGLLVCTYRQHKVAASEFGKTQGGTIDSWCNECRREHNRKQKAIKARAARLVTSSVAQQTSLVHVIHRTNNSIAGQ